MVLANREQEMDAGIGIVVGEGFGGCEGLGMCQEMGMGISL
jgi:hypothetical protein